MAAERIVVVVVAAAAIVLLAAGLSAARAEDELFERAFRPPAPSAAELERAAAKARRAQWAVPGERRALLEATLRLEADDAAGAVRVLRGVIRREPANAEGWLLLSRAAAEADPALARRAAQRVRELVPSVPPP